MFAVIKTGGKQYRVAADDLLEVERIVGDTGDMIEFANVLAVGEGDKTDFGAPFVNGAMVTAEVVEQHRGPKVITFKKRRRQNSRRTRGHRQLLTTVRISEILTGGAKPSKKASAKKEKPAGEEKAKPAEAKSTETAKTKSSEAKSSAPKPAKGSTKGKEAPKTDKTAENAKSGAPLFKAPKGKADDLTRIKGIGPVASGQLGEQGIITFAQIAALSDEDIARIDQAMPFSAEQIADWREQAKALVK